MADVRPIVRRVPVGLSHTYAQEHAEYALTQMVSGRGPPHFHMHIPNERARRVQKFLTEFLYNDMNLFIGILCSLGCVILSRIQTQLNMHLHLYHPKRLHNTRGL